MQAWAFYLLLSLVAIVSLVFFGILVALASASGVTPAEIEKNTQNLKIAVYTIATIILVAGAGGAAIAIYARAKEEDKKKKQAQFQEAYIRNAGAVPIMPMPAAPPPMSTAPPVPAQPF